MQERQPIATHECDQIKTADIARDPHTEGDIHTVKIVSPEANVWQMVANMDYDGGGDSSGEDIFANFDIAVRIHHCPFCGEKLE